jgi:hypothetical protein
MPITELDKLQAYENVRDTLLGVMKMAEIEIKYGSQAWIKVDMLVKDALRDLEELKP